MTTGLASTTCGKGSRLTSTRPGSPGSTIGGGGGRRISSAPAAAAVKAIEAPASQRSKGRRRMGFMVLVYRSRQRSLVAHCARRRRRDDAPPRGWTPARRFTRTQ
ncbi:MAG: hypothetical protein KJ023_06510 [Burkholderiaceae bacterium]|nr:hypothetical protein [Burkholderiaceae bacterium]